MQNKEDKDDNIITPSVEISDLSPPLPQSYDDLSTDYGEDLQTLDR